MEGSPYRKFSIFRRKGSDPETEPRKLHSGEPGFLLAGILGTGVLPRASLSQDIAPVILRSRVPLSSDVSRGGIGVGAGPNAGANGEILDKVRGNMCYLDNSPHPIDIESGPSPEDRVRCCIKSIKTLGWRLQTGCNIYRSSWVRALIPRTSRFPRINLQVQNDQNMKPLGASDSREESSGTTSSYKTYVDTSG
ncbi:hypothetical protein F2Q68_00005399 [Brassica cretica]|uniref:Uncharacterized protein n=1 Tax=Brassica cretica TaxID=69181 RepID=A0A8S9JLQ6_BRACR|nr:hypothetical protein F2Q68_00005399 [Brassica cretica]